MSDSKRLTITQSLHSLITLPVIGKKPIRTTVRIDIPLSAGIYYHQTTSKLKKMSCIYKLHMLLIFIAITALAILPLSCSCNNGIGGGWNPDWLYRDYRIAFMSSRDGNEMGDLYLMDLDGENQIRIGNTPAWGSAPRWSPDGTRIAFYTGEQWDGYTLHIVDDDGNSLADINDITNAAPFSPGQYFVYSMWSPDSTKIAFSYPNSEDGTGDVYTVDSDGNNLTSIVTMPGRSVNNLQWSPDSTKILFQSDQPMDNADSLYVVDNNGSNLILLDANIRYNEMATWSPDSSKIAYTAYDDETSDIWVINADGTGLVNITNGNYGQQAGQPSWSFDSKKITFTAYSSTEDGYSMDSYRVNADGTGITKITRNGDGFAGEIPSPDGSRILQGFQREETMFFYLTDADGQDPVRIMENVDENLSGFAWAPDSSKFAYSTWHRDTDNPDERNMAAHDIFVINADGTGLVNLASATADIYSYPEWFTWSPDSQKIIFSDTIDDNQDIFIIKTDGTGLVNLTNDPSRDWGPILPQ